jgi:hypothetical protein
VSAEICIIASESLLISAATALVPHYTSGQVFYYPGFNAAVHEDAVKFAVELSRLIAMPVMLEAEMRVRCSWGELLIFFRAVY